MNTCNCNAVTGKMRTCNLGACLVLVGLGLRMLLYGGSAHMHFTCLLRL